MEGLFFLSSIIGIGLVIHWFIRNDGAAPAGPTTGLLAMRDPAAKAAGRPAAAGGSPGRRHLRARP